MTEQDFLKQMAAMQRACADTCKAFIVDNPDSDLEDFAEEQYEDSSGDAALCELWLEIYPGDEGAEANNSIRKEALDWQRKRSK